MTVEEAVITLRKFHHNGHDNWTFSGSDSKDMIIMGDDQYENFSPFEAIAIAEKYVSLSQTEKNK